MCEDYRAAASVDLVHDRASRAGGERVRCPMLVLWGAQGRIGGWYDALAIWRQYCAAEVQGGPVSSGHYLPGRRGWIKTKNRGYWRYSLELEAAVRP